MNYVDERLESILERLGSLEERQRRLAEVLIEYVRADMAAPWMGPARRLEAVLEDWLK